MCIALGVALIVAGCSGTTESASPAAGGDDATTALAAWMARNLPDGTTVSVDTTAVRSALVVAGVAATVDPSDTGATSGYRVADDDAGADVASVRPLAADLTAVAVARFGTGGSGWRVDRVLAAPAAQIAAGLARDTARRAAAGSALLVNPRVSVCAACRRELAAGGLDLRAASLVAVLASAGSVVVEQIVADAAETGVGQPARALVIGGASPGTVRALAGATVGAYRPTITDVTTTTTTLTWALAVPTTLTGA